MQIGLANPRQERPQTVAPGRDAADHQFARFQMKVDLDAIAKVYFLGKSAWNADGETIAPLLNGSFHPMYIQ
jgi:hypothetical protein